VSEGSYKKNMPARNTLVQLLALYTNRESPNRQRVSERQADRQTDGQTDDRITPIAEHTL